MKKLLNKSVILLLVLFSATKLSATDVLEANLLPDSVVTIFKGEHESAIDIRWNPYPYKYVPADIKSEEYPDLFEKPLFFEAQFKEHDTINTKVYNSYGECMVWKKSIDVSKIDQYFTNQIAMYDLKKWRIESFEIIEQNVDSKHLHHNTQYKMVLIYGTNSEVFLFNENKELINNFSVEHLIDYNGRNKNLYIETIYNGARANTTAKELPAIVKEKIGAESDFNGVVSCVVQEPVDLILQKHAAAFANLNMRPTYEVVINEGNSLNKMVYNDEGLIIDKSELVHIEKLPRYIKDKIKDSMFSSWQFESYAEVQSPSKDINVYTLFAIENGIPQMMVIHVN